MQLRGLDMNSLGYENSTTEFKLVLNDKLEKEVIAFLNSSKGGDIYIGVNDNGDIVGVENADKMQLAITDRIKNNIMPTCLGFFDVLQEEHEGKAIIHIVVARGLEKPYYLKRYGMVPTGCYIRMGSGIQQMTAKMIDKEVKSIIDLCYSRAENILKENLDKLNVMADALLKYETIDANQIDDIMAGATPREPKGWSDDTPSGKSTKKSSIKGTAEEL